MAADKKNKTSSCVLGVETLGQRKRYGRGVSILGPSKLIYSPAKPLPCGAKAWVETYGKVVVHR